MGSHNVMHQATTGLLANDVDPAKQGQWNEHWKVEVAEARRGFPPKWHKSTMDPCSDVWGVHAASLFVDFCLSFHEKQWLKCGKWAIIDAPMQNHRQLCAYAVIRPRSLRSHATTGTETLSTGLPDHLSTRMQAFVIIRCKHHLTWRINQLDTNKRFVLSKCLISGI